MSAVIEAIGRKAATAKSSDEADLSELERRLLNDFQRDFPLCARPYAVLAQRLGVSEKQVLQGLERLSQCGALSRVGPVFRPNRIGCSTLAAMSVPPERLVEVAALVSARPEVNHNYEREHRYNLWFVLTAPDEDRLQAVLQDIEACSGIAVLSLPMVDDYHIDLGFQLSW